MINLDNFRMDIISYLKDSPNFHVEINFEDIGPEASLDPAQKQRMFRRTSNVSNLQDPSKGVLDLREEGNL